MAAVANAFLHCKAKGIRRFVSGALSFAHAHEHPEYEDLVARGMNELGNLLSSHGVI